jgi:hypothetical protein
MFAIWIPSLARSSSVFGSSISCFCWFNHSLFLYLIFGDVPKDVPNQIYFTAHLCFWFQYFLLLLSCFHDYFRVPKWRFPEIGLSTHHPFLVGDLEHGFLFFHILGIIIPFDFQIFQRSRYTTNQVYLFIHSLHPPTHSVSLSLDGPSCRALWHCSAHWYNRGTNYWYLYWWP